MNKQELQGVVLRAVLAELAGRGEPFVPVMSSNRHIHLCQADVEKLFGAGYQLTVLRPLGQPGQYACNETVTMETEKGRQSLRVVGPARRETQIELSMTDCYRLGVKPVLRMSGDTAGTPGCTLANGDKRITIDHGVVVAARHLHMSPAEAAAYGLRDGDVVEMRVEGPRAITIGNLVVRSGPAHSLEAHIDKDEANACGLADGALCRLRLPGGRAKAAPPPVNTPAEPECAPHTAGTAEPKLYTYVPGTVKPQLQTCMPEPPAAAPAETALMDISGERRRLLTEDDVLAAVRDGQKIIRYAPDAIITPLARDAAGARGVELTETK